MGDLSITALRLCNCDYLSARGGRTGGVAAGLGSVAGGGDGVVGGGGDLLVIGGTAQRTWQHSVPKVAHAGPRISLAFRHGLDPQAYSHKRDEPANRETLGE